MDNDLTGLKQAKKTLMVEHAVLSLKEYIIDRNISPGTELPAEGEMAKKIGVSKFSLREALRVLQVLGLIDISQGRRTRVASHSINPIISLLELTLKRSMVPNMQLIEARKSLEGHISRYAAIRAHPSQIEAMRETISAMDRHRDDLEMCVKQDLEFHNALVKASKNIVFEIMLAPLMELLRDQRREQIKVRGIDLVIEYHTMILSAIMKHDPDEAEKCMDLHLVRAEEDVRKVEQTIQAEPKPPDTAD
jgi:GntR family transcriptional repressor for pyruvate dehydrogenase complex